MFLRTAKVIGYVIMTSTYSHVKDNSKNFITFIEYMGVKTLLLEWTLLTTSR